MKNCKLVTCFLNLKPGPMSCENENSAERIKQKIELKKETLKLLNSFYLPLVSGIVLLVVRESNRPSKDKEELCMGELHISSAIMAFVFVVFMKIIINSLSGPEEEEKKTDNQKKNPLRKV